MGEQVVREVAKDLLSAVEYLNQRALTVPEALHGRL
jgi:hypothetical protein